MTTLLDYPWLLFALSATILWLSAQIGASLLRRHGMDQDVRGDFNTILLATLTLNGLIIGFSFSMSVTRYEQRKNYEEAEANAIGTEYLRADMLAAADAATVRSLLLDYLQQRILFYQARDATALRDIDARTAQLSTNLWAAVRSASAAQATPTVALALAGMNEVLNSRGYTQAAWWNRIPTEAWVLMIAIAIIGNLLVGFGAKNVRAERMLLLMILPCVFATSYLLIADIESPRGGIIRVNPRNLISLWQSLAAHDSPTATAGSLQP